LLDVASTALDGFADSEMALTFEIFPKVRSVDCLLAEAIESYQRQWRCSVPSVFGHEVGSRYGFSKKEGTFDNPRNLPDSKLLLIAGLRSEAHDLQCLMTISRVKRVLTRDVMTLVPKL